MLQTLFKAIGGLAGDAVETVKIVGNEIIDAPSAMVDGFQEGLMITPNNKLTQAELEAVIAEAEAKKAAAAQTTAA